MWLGRSLPGWPVATRARPRPDDLVAASDATGISVVELLDAIWGIDRRRLAGEVARLGVGSSFGPRLDALSDAQRREVADYVEFLATRRSGQVRRTRP